MGLPGQEGSGPLSKSLLLQYVFQHMVRMDPCGITGNKHQHRPQLHQDHRCKRGQQQQHRPSCHHALGGNTGLSDQNGLSRDSKMTQLVAQTQSNCTAFSGRGSHRLQHRPWLWRDHGPRHSPQQQLGSGSLRAPRRQCRPLTLVAPVVAWPPGINVAHEGVQTPGVLMAFGDNRNHSHQHRTQLQQGHRPRQGPWQQPRPGCQHSLRWQAGLPHPVPYHLHPFRSACLHRA